METTTPKSKPTLNDYHTNASTSHQWAILVKDYGDKEKIIVQMDEYSRLSYTAYGTLVCPITDQTHALLLLVNFKEIETKKYYTYILIHNNKITQFTTPQGMIKLECLKLAHSSVFQIGHPAIESQSGIYSIDRDYNIYFLERQIKVLHNELNNWRILDLGKKSLKETLVKRCGKKKIYVMSNSDKIYVRIPYTAFPEIDYPDIIKSYGTLYVESKLYKKEITKNKFIQMMETFKKANPHILHYDKYVKHVR